MEALLILLRRLAYPNRWCELVSLFGRAEPELSIIFNMVGGQHKKHKKLKKINSYIVKLFLILIGDDDQIPGSHSP